MKELEEERGFISISNSESLSESPVRSASNSDNYVIVPNLDSSPSSISSIDYLNVKTSVVLEDATSSTPLKDDSRTKLSTGNTLVTESTTGDIPVPLTTGNIPVPLTDFEPQSVNTMGSPLKTAYSATDQSVGTLDREWKIRYRQFLACMLSEPVLNEYFEKPFDLASAMRKQKLEGGFKHTPISP